MKTIKTTGITFLTVVLIACSSINCNAQIKPKKQKEQQVTVEYPETKIVYKDVGTKSEELQGELQIALGNNDIEVLTILLKKGANANKLPGNTDMTPLMLAETKEIVQLLLENGANPLVIDNNGQNLLHYAVSKENALDLIPLYVSHGVDINARDQEDDTPITLAINYFYEAKAFDTQVVFVGDNNQPNEIEFKPDPYKTLEILVKSGVNLNEFNQYGNTLLMDCVTKDSSELVNILLELGADKNIKNNYGETAKDLAYDLGRRYIYQLLE